MNLRNMDDVKLLLLGCGNMGSALLQGWLKSGLQPSNVTILDPYPSTLVKDLEARAAAVNPDQIMRPHVAILAVKPQMIEEVAPMLSQFSNGETLFVSIAAGTPIRVLEDILGTEMPIIRAMPNTPAAIGKGISALIGNSNVTEVELQMAEMLLQAVGRTVRLDNEFQMDGVTAVSGSGPAYVFHLIETLALAGQAEGLSEGLSLLLAKATVSGAGQLAEQSNETPSQLRINVTSPNGTTSAALRILMDDNKGFPALLRTAVKAAANRNRELS